MTQMSRERLCEQVDQADLTDDAKALLRLLAGRYSCRGYRQERVSRSIIAQMLTIAQLSASWCNSQPWQTIVTEGEGTERFRKALYDHAVADQATNGGVPKMQPDIDFPVAYRGVFKERQRDVGRQLYESVGIAHGDRTASGKQALENFRFFGAPHVLVVTSERDLGAYGAIDTGLYLGSLLLAAQSLGLGMIPQAALAVYAPLMRDYFGIPDNRAIVVGASFGYANDTHAANGFRSGRASLDAVVQWFSD